MADWVPPEARGQSNEWVPPEAQTRNSTTDSLIKGAKGTAAAVADTVTGLIRFPLGIGMGLGGVLTGERPDIARDAGHEMAEDILPSFGKDMHDNQAYEWGMKPFEWLNKGIDWVGENLSDDPGRQGAIKQALDIGTFALPEVGKRGYDRVKGFLESDPLMDRSRSHNEPAAGATPDIQPQGPREMVAEPVIVDGRPEPSLKQGWVPPEFKKDAAIGETRTKEEIALDEANQQEANKTFQGAQQGELYAPENPYIPPETRTFVDENGIPVTEIPSREIAQADYEQAPQGDLFKSREPTLESRLVPRDVQDVIRPTEEQVIPRTNLTLEPVDQIPLRNANPETVPYERVDPSEISRDRQLTLEERPEEVSAKNKMTTREQAAITKYHKGAAKEEIEFQDTIARIEGEVMPRELKGKHPFAKKQGGAIHPEAFYDTMKKLDDRLKELKNDGILGYFMRPTEIAKLPFKEQLQGIVEYRRETEAHNRAYRDLDKIGGRDKYGRIKDDKGSDYWSKQKQKYLNDPKTLETAYESILDHAASVMSHQDPDVHPTKGGFDPHSEIPKGWDETWKKINKGPGGKQSGAFDPSEIGKGLAKIFNKSKPKTPTPERTEPKLEKGIKEYLSSDTRSAEEFIKQEANKQNNWKDISRYWTNFLPGSNIAEIAKHPAIKWIVSQAQNHTRKALLNKEESKYGAKFAPRGGINKNRWNARMRSDDGALTVFENMKWADAKDALKLWIDKYDGNNITMDAQSLAADGMKPQQIKAILAARKQLDAFAKQYNAEAAKHGYPRITPRSNYFPHVYRGDYRVFVRDSKGEAKWVEGAETKRQASAMRDELAKRFPGLDVQFREASNKYDINDTQSFRDALGILPKNSAEYKALQQAYTDILKRRGFQKATLFRKGAPGFMGMKDGKAGIKEGLEGLAMYFDRGHNFLANQRIRSDLGEILSGLKKAGTDLKQLTPNAHEYMGAYVDNATNATKDGLQMVTDVIEAIGQSTGQGKSFVSNNLGKVNALASALWLTTPKFALAQFLQPLFNIPAGLKLKHLTGSSASVLNAWGRSYKEYISPSAYTIEAMNWAKENGYIDSKILDLMGLKHETYASKLGKAAQLYTRWGLGKIEQEVVRSPSFIFYDHLLKDVIKDKVQRWKTAGELTDKVMVNYATVDAPLMYSKSGIVGEAARPLKQFSHSYFGQMLEYMQHAKDKGDVKPLATMLAIQANVSGLKGMMGLAEATLVINAINSTFNTQIPTPNQLLATMGAPEWLRFGTVSSVTGLDLSGTTGAPQIGQMATLPGAQFAGKGIHDIGGYAADLATGMDTEAGKMKAMQSIAPTLAQGSIEDYFTKPGMGPPNPNNKMQPDTGPRDFEDRFYRNVIGGRSVKETEERENLKALKQKDLKDRALKTKILDTIVDRFVEGKENSDELVQKWLELGGNPDSLPNEIIGQMKKRSMTYIERYINGQQGLSLAQKATKLKEFGLMIENATPEELSQFMEDIK